MIQILLMIAIVDCVLVVVVDCKSKAKSILLMKNYISNFFSRRIFLPYDFWP